MNSSKVVLRILGICVSILIFVLIIFGIIKLGSFVYDTGYRIFTEEAVDQEPGRDVVIQVEKNVSARSLGELLEKNGLIKDDLVFALQMTLFSKKNPVQPGEYTLNTSQTPREMLVIMTTEPETEDTE